MQTLRILSTISIIICHLLSSSTAAKKPYKFKKEWSISKNVSKTMALGSFFATDSNDVSYAVCEMVKPNSEKLCNITLVSSSDITPTSKKTCNHIRIFASENRELFLGGYFQIWQFTKDHVVIGWWDNTPKDNEQNKTHNIHINIQNMAECKSSHKKFAIDKVGYGSFPSLLLYNDSVHVVLNSQETCNAPGNCRVAFDLEGTQIGGPFPYAPNVTGYASPVSSTNVSKGFFMEVQDTKSVQVFLIDQAGNGKALVKDEFEEEADNQTVVFSSTHEHYSVCRATNLLNDSAVEKSVKCYQYNATVDLISKNTFELPNPAASIAIHNLAEGGIALMAAGRNTTKINKTKSGNFYVYKVGSNGLSRNFIMLDKPDIECRKDSNPEFDHPDIKISEFDGAAKKMCFYFACLKSSDKDLQIGVRCIAKDDFLSRLT